MASCSNNLVPFGALLVHYSNFPKSYTLYELTFNMMSDFENVKKLMHTRSHSSVNTNVHIPGV